MPDMWDLISKDMVDYGDRYQLDYFDHYKGDVLAVSVTRPKLGSSLMVSARWGGQDITQFLYSHIRMVLGI
ncbi:hypothetical protein EOM86_05645 [Candidatus Nomurabacteria bacterium]|nr:hypothetical protein [Candidatus Nomurabacteria bacterium]